MIEEIKRLSAELHGDIVAMRRRIHAHPELATNEVETSRFVASVLQDAGIPFEREVAGTGVVGFIDGALPGPQLMLRADMDALPIVEETELDFASTIPGCMHACGHDAHTASLLGAAMILMRMRDQLRGSVRLVFQPAEERLPGGAKPMIEAGVLGEMAGRPGPDLVFAQHVTPELQSGTIGVRSGMYMASADELFITVRGQGGHAASPNLLGTDVVLASAHIIMALQTIVSRHAPPASPSVLSIGRVIADGATNVLPAACRMEGTFRAMDETWRFRAHELMRRIVMETASAHGATADIEVRVGYPALENDESATALVRRAAIDFVGEDRVVDLDMWFASEDFAWFLRERPGSFYRLGTGGTERTSHSLHTSKFDIDEDALHVGAGFLAYLALAYADLTQEALTQ
jgi:amidohydrolase